MNRWYLGVDWADRAHAVWVEDEAGTKVVGRTVAHTGEGLAELGRWLDEQRADGIELWAAIERPDGSVVDLLLDHGVVVYPINPKALDRARDRFRMSQAKSDPFDAQVLAAFLRTDHAHFTPLQPSSEAAQELKLLTRDCQRLIRQQARLRNQLVATLKAYYPRALELFGDINTPTARAFLAAFPTPDALAALRPAAWRPLGPGPPRQAPPGRLGALPTTPGAGARACGAGEGPVAGRVAGAVDHHHGGRGQLPRGDRGFFRRHARG